MKIKIAALCACAALIATPVAAQKAPVKPQGLPETGLTIGDCLILLAGHNGLDGRQDLTKDGSSVVVISYKFENAKLRTTIQQNISALMAVQQDFQKTQNALLREIGGPSSEIKPNSPEAVRYGKLVSDAQELPCKAQLGKIAISDLRLDRNEIPGSVLGALGKVLE